MNKQKKIFLMAVSFLFLNGIHLKATAAKDRAPIVIQEQGSFSIDWSVIQT